MSTPSGNASGRGKKGGRGFGKGRGKPHQSKRPFRSYKSTTTTTTDERDKRFDILDKSKPVRATYTSVKEQLILHVQGSMVDGPRVAKSLDEMQWLDWDQLIPLAKVSTNPDAAQRQKEDDAFKLLQQEEMRRYADNKDNYNNQMKAVYSIILSKYCTTQMKNKIEQLSDFNSKIKDDPIELLKAIKKLMHDATTKQLFTISASEAMRQYFTIKQGPEESLNDYYRRFKHTLDNMKIMNGTDFYVFQAKLNPEYNKITDPSRKQAKFDAAPDKCIAYWFLQSVDQNKYGSLLKHLATNYATGGRDDYPLTLRDALEVLSNREFDEKYKEVQKKRRDKEKHDKEHKKDGTLHTSFAQKGKFACYCCGSKDHNLRECPEKDTRPKDKWHNPKHSHHQDGVPSTAGGDDSSVQSSVTSASNASSNRRSVGSTNTTKTQATWAKNISNLQMLNNILDVCHMIVNQQSHTGINPLKDVIILDTGSSIHATFMNPDMVINIKRSKRPISMGTNAGSKVLTLEATLLGFGMVWYDPTHLANILGYKDLRNRYKIDYDHDKDSFYVHTEHGVVEFEGTNYGLYIYQPSKEFFNEVARIKNMAPPNEVGTPMVSNLVSTVKENKHFLTPRQQQRAKEARDLYHILGPITSTNFKHLLKTNILRDTKVIAEDVNLADKVYGQDIGDLKGKTTRRKPDSVVEDLVEIPPELIEQHENLHLCIDIMYVHSYLVFASIDKSIKYRVTVPMKNRTSKELFRAIDVVLRQYNDAGFTVTKIYCDREFQYLMEKVKDDLGVTMDYTAHGNHVPEAERNIRTLKERIRAIYHTVPFKDMPPQLWEFAALVAAFQLNIVPAKGGVSPYYSPHMIITKKALSCKKHLVAPFGSYVQAVRVTEPTNTNRPRTIDAIYLRPLMNDQGGHQVMNLHTGEVITTPRVVKLPMTDMVIRRVEEMARAAGTISLKFGSRFDRQYPADWIAGVDYEDDPHQNDQDDDDTDEDFDQVEAENNDDDNWDDWDDNSMDFDNEHEPIEDDEVRDLIRDMENDDAAEVMEAQDEEIEFEEADDEPEVEQVGNEPVQIEDHTSDEDANPTVHEEEDTVPEDEVPEDEPPDEPPMAETVDLTEEEPVLRRSTRTITAPERLTFNNVVQFEDDDWYQTEVSHNLVAEKHRDKSVDVAYHHYTARVIARMITDIHSKVMREGVQFSQQYLVQNGYVKFGQKGSEAALKELDQLHKRSCFTPIDPKDMTASEKKKAQVALMFVTQKRDGRVKGRLVYNGKPTREWYSREEAASPTVTLESIMLTSIIDAKEGRDVMTADIPNAFIQAQLPPRKEGEERVIMKITGVLVDLLVELDSETYGPYVVFENGKKVLYVEVLRGLYGMLIAALLFYRQFRKDLKKFGFKFNNYDPCVANKIVEGLQQTIKFHVDDVNSSHMLAKVNDEFLVWLNKMYGKHGEVKATRGKVHDYLGMTFDYSVPGKVKVDMTEYMKGMVKDFSVKLGSKDKAPTPAGDDLFTVDDESPVLDKSKAQEFHTLVAKGLFACKRARPDIHPTIAFLCTRVKSPTHQDWNKLMRLMKYINGTVNDVLTLSADDLHVIKWYVDASFAVHQDFKSHTGAIMSYGTGAPITMSRKQKLNTRSSTEAELVGADDLSTMILWTKLFLEDQGYEVKKNILYQDNKAAILLEENGKKSSSKRTRALNIRYFFMTDQVEKKNLAVHYCPTNEMIGDFMTKPLQGKKFQDFKDLIMGNKSVSFSNG